MYLRNYLNLHICKVYLWDFMQKKICSILIFLLCFSTEFVFSQSHSVVSVFEKLSVIETEYFDIIFPKTSEQTAQYIAPYADELYLKAAAFLHVKKLDRIPVIITKKTDELNAYFTTLTHNRIVLYDTLPSGELTVFSDSILSVFYHELIHAVSLNNAYSGRWFIDDVMSFFTSVDMPPSMIEGVAVLAESTDGFGRLNNSYSTHVIRQAKIENKFPHWSDIAGSYSLYTDGSLPYIFGGAFTDYLYRTYGALKLAEFWSESAKIDVFLYDVTFKKVYGLSISEAWKNFENSIPIPYVTGLDVPLFDDLLQKYTYQNLSASNEGIVWQDAYSSTVYFLPNGSELGKEKKLFTTDLDSRIHISNDGRFLSVSGQTGYPQSKNKTNVYDMEKKKFVRKQKDIRDGAVIQLPASIIHDTKNVFYQSEFILSGVETNGQVSSLVFYDLFSDDVNDVLTSIPFDFGTVVFEPVDAGNGIIIALMFKDGEWSFYSYNCNTNESQVFSITDGENKPSNISSLFVKNSVVYMSLAMDAQSQPVIARVSLNDFLTDTLAVQVQQMQRSGGVFSPVIVSNDANEGLSERVVYVSRYYEHRELSTMPLHTDDFKTLSFQKVTENTHAEDVVYFDTKKYNPLHYYFDGMFVPFIGSVNLSPIDDMFTGFSLGASAFFLDPVERLLIGGGAGYDVFTDKYSAAITSVFTERNFLLSYDGYIDFTQTGMDKAASKVSAEVFFPIISDYNRIGLSNSFRMFYSEKTDTQLKKGFTLDNAFTVYFSRLRRTSESYYSNLGLVFFNQLYLNSYIGSEYSSDDEVFLGTISSVELYIPQLIPIRNPKQWTLNIPVVLSFSKYIGFTADWNASANAVFLSYEVQSAIPFMHLFFQRISLDGGASYTANNNGTYSVLVKSSVFTTLALNTSSATGYPVETGLSFEWNPLDTSSSAYKFGLKMSLNF